MTIRPFDWRDLPFLYRIHERGLCLHAQRAFTRGPHVLSHALLDVFSSVRGAATLVVRPSEPDELAAVGQIVHRPGEAQARLTYVAPAEALESSSGLRLLDGLAQSAGSRGAQNLIAEVDEHTPAFECLRRAGFAIYARQRLWRLEPAAEPPRAAEPEAIRSPNGPVWRPEEDRDAAAIQNLYLDLVPALVQQVEPLPPGDGRGLVHLQQEELLAYLDIERGPLGVWVQPYFHPAAEAPDLLLTSFLSQRELARRRPLVVCVRSYQGWMNGLLPRLGFQPAADQAVMVKRLTAGVRRPARAPLPAIEGTRPEPTAPFSSIERRAPTSSPDRAQ
jgi:hypothetical protein